MAESTLSLTRDELRRRAALILSYGTDPARWDPNQQQQIDICVLDGIREAYWPVKDGKPYEWSFMKVSLSFATASGTSAYTMADSFWQVPDRVVVATGSGGSLIDIIEADHLIQIRTVEGAANATPLYAAFRPTSIPLSTSVSTRWECLLYPTPNATLTMQMHVAVSPDSIMSANNYPIGSAMFAQTLIAAVQMMAERYYVAASDTSSQPNQSGEMRYEKIFNQRLQATMVADNAIKASSATWAVTEPEYGTFNWFKRVCSIYEFNQPNLAMLTKAQSGECEANVRSGLIRFYAPPSLSEGEKPWSWSFLNCNATLPLINGTAVYDLPTDFATMSGEFNFVTAATDKLRMTRISYEDISALKASSAATGNPKYFAISEKTSTGGSTKSRYEVTFYPTPTASENATYRYVRSPAALSSSATYPAGNELHSECIAAACRSVCEERKADNQGVEWQKFTALLSSSIKLDQQLMESGKIWDVASDPEYGTFNWFKREIAICLFKKTSLNSLENEESRECEAIIRAGLARFYSPPALSDKEQPWSWSFLNANTTLAITNGTATYDLPTDLATMAGDFNFVTTATDKLRISRISYEQLSAVKASLAATGNPKYFCISQKASTGGSSKSRYEVTFYPTPTSNENLTYRYVRSPAVLTSTNLYAIGPDSNTEVMVAACRSICEERTPGNQGLEWQKFMSLLSSAVKTDRQIVESEAGVWDTAADPEYGTFNWFKRVAAICLYKKKHLATLTNEESRECEADVRSGMSRFYMPPSLDPTEAPWSWTFLNANATIALTSPTTTYDLPTDFATMGGDFTYAAVGVDRLRISQVSYEDLTAMQVSNPTSGNPKYFCVSQKASTGGATKSRYEVSFFPTPSSSLTVNYRYVKSPAALSSSATYALGSDLHTECAAAAIRSVCEERLGGQQGPEWQKFTALLSGCIRTDRQLVSNMSASWSVETPQYGSLRWLTRRIGEYMGFGAASATWGHFERETVSDIVNRGVRNLQASRDWSFLKYEATMTLASPTFTYALPVDMVPGSIKSFSYSGAVKQTIEICSPDAILSRKAMENDPSGAPRYAGLRSTNTDIGELVHRQEVIFFPKPDATYTLKYHYKLLPPLLSDANPHPAGGESLAEAYLASCRLVAANTKGDPQAIESAYAEFNRTIEAASKADSGASTGKDSFANTPPAMGTYAWFQQEIGLAMNFGANPGDWNYTQLQTVNSMIDKAHADFCSGYMFGQKTDSAHRWSFLHPEATVTTSAPYSTGTVTVASGVVTLAGGTFPTWAASAWLSVAGVQYSVSTRDSGTQVTLTNTTINVAAGATFTIYRREYDFPSDMHAIDSGMVSLNSGSFFALKNVDARTIDETLPYAWEAGLPQMFACTETAPGVTGVTHRFILKPIPDGVYELRFRYSIGIPTFSAGMLCAGGAIHAQTILCCALANLNTARQKEAQSRMAASIAQDRSRQSENIGSYRDERATGHDRYHWDANRVTSFNGSEWD